MTLAIVEPGYTAVIVETGDVKPAPTIRIIVTAWRREQSSYAAFYNTSCWLFFRTVATDLVAALVALLVPAASRSPDDGGAVHGNPANGVPGGRNGAVSSFHGCGDIKT